MMKPRTKSIKALTFSAALCASLGLSFSANAETIEVQKLKHAGPYPVANPWMPDMLKCINRASGLKVKTLILPMPIVRCIVKASVLLGKITVLHNKCRNRPTGIIIRSAYTCRIYH